MEMEMEPHQVLPTDLVLEIAARSSTPAAIVRWAATSKPLRRGILHPAFLHRVNVIPRDGGDGHDRFIPTLLLGLFHHQTQDPRRPPAFVAAAAEAPSLTLDLGLPAPTTQPNHDADHRLGELVFGSCWPVASRRSLVVLRRRRKISSQEQHHQHHGVELSVCNPVTGERWELPPHDVHDETHALLDVNRDMAPAGGGSYQSFKLVVAELPASSPSSRALIVQVFSEEERAWGPPLACAVSRDCTWAHVPKPVVRRGATAVVYWLCVTYSVYRILKWQRRGSNNDDNNGAEPRASLMKLPPSCDSGVQDMCLALLPSTDGTTPQESLSVLVLEDDHVAVWVRTGRCSRVHRHAIREGSIARPVDVAAGWLRKTGLRWFCGESGTLFLGGGESGDPLLLNLDSMAVKRVHTVRCDPGHEPEFCPYEVDLFSYMLFVMRAF